MSERNFQWDDNDFKHHDSGADFDDFLNDLPDDNAWDDDFDDYRDTDSNDDWEDRY